MQPCHYVISAGHTAPASQKGSIMSARNFTPNPPTFYAIFHAYGRSYFVGGHHTGAEVLQFYSKADREDFIERSNGAHGAYVDPVAWSVTAKEAYQYVNPRAYSLNCHEEVCHSSTGLAICHYNTCQIF